MMRVGSRDGQTPQWRRQIRQGACCPARLEAFAAQSSYVANADVCTQNAFLIKQGSGRIQLSREKGNLLNKNSFRCSGLANSKARHIGAPNGLETSFAVKSGNKFQNSLLKSKVST